MDSFIQDIRLGIRQLRRNPLVAAITILGLALAIGANAALFSLANAILLRPLRFADSERLVILTEAYPERGLEGVRAAPAKYLDWKRESRSVEHFVAYEIFPLSLTGTDSPEQLQVGSVSHDFFELLGTQPFLGRGFTVEEEEPGNDMVVILGHEIWQRRFGARADVIGQTLGLEGVQYTIIGVLPADFGFPEGTQVWIPLALETWLARSVHSLWALARLRPGVSLDQARSEMASIAANLEARYPDTDRGWRIDVDTLHAHLVGDIRPSLILLLGSAGLVLLIGCANLANILLARAAHREQELVLRSAIGASRGRLLRQLLTEALLLCSLGGIAGLVVAVWGTRLLVALSPSDLPRADEIGLDWRVIAFAALVTLLTAMAVGLGPAIRGSRPELRPMLHSASRGGGGGPRKLLVAGEIALALVLITGASLLVQTLARLRAVDPGIRTESLLTAKIQPPYFRYTRTAQRGQLFAEVLDEIAELPGVTAFGATSHLPFAGAKETFRILIEGRPRPEPSEIPTAEMRSVSPGYFATIGIGVRAGRTFVAGDDQEGPLVAIVNEAMARAYWPDREPLGQRLSIDGPEGPWRTVVGVVGDVRHFGLDREPPPELYVPYQQEAWRTLILVLRTPDDPHNHAAAVREAVWAVDTDMPVTDVQTMEGLISSTVAGRRFNALLSGLFGIVALVLAVSGVYGVMSYAIATRTREMGIRMALGARAGDVVREIVGEGACICAVGLAAGLAGALAIARMISGLLYGIEPSDPLTWLGAPMLLLVAGILASYIPARRAAGLDPAEVLRSE